MDLRLGRALPYIDRRTIVGLGLAALAAAGVLWVTRPVTSHPVLVAGSDLPAGTPLSDLPIEVRRTSEPAGMIEGTDVGDLADWTLRFPISDGEPLIPSMLQPPQLLDAPSLLAVDLEASHAVLGRIAPGDLVDVYVTGSASVGDPRVTELAASSVYVVEARTVDGAGGERVELLIAVDDTTAAVLTEALRTGELDLVRVGP